MTPWLLLALCLTPRVAHATRMPGVGDAALLLAMAGAAVGAAVATIAVTVLAIARADYRDARRLALVWLGVTLAFPAAAVVLGFFVLIAFS